jgi:MYXO-CTERM domain-containing protein
VKRFQIGPTLTLATLAVVGSVHADVVTIPQSVLIPSTTYYTQDIGGGLGSPLIMTGGGNAANVGFSRNDDGFSGPIGLGFTFNLFGTNYTTFFANNNGNVSFGNGIAAFTPTGPQGATQPIISPFFADVDTRNAASGLMYLRNDITKEIIVTWDQVGYFNSHADKLDSFQLVLRGPGFVVPAGEGQIGFFWKAMQWETGDASGGTGGFGGTPAAVGFGDGLSNGQILQGSTQNGISGVVNNKRLWFNLSDTGVPSPVDVVPEPPSRVLTLAIGLLVVAGAASRRRRFARS